LATMLNACKNML